MRYKIMMVLWVTVVGFSIPTQAGLHSQVMAQTTAASDTPYPFPTPNPVTPTATWLPNLSLCVSLGNTKSSRPIYGFSPDGTQIAFEKSDEVGLYIMNTDGTNPHHVTTDAVYSIPRWSVDSKQIAFITRTPNVTEAGLMGYFVQIQSINVDTLQRKILFREDNAYPSAGNDEVGFFVSWSPNGEYLAFTTNDYNALYSKLHIYDFKASADQDTGIFVNKPLSWSPDSKTLLFEAPNAPQGDHIYKLNIGQSTPEILTTGSSPVWSPDGKQIAFNRYVNGKMEIFVTDVANRHEQLLISPGQAPLWSPDGQYLAYQAGENNYYDVYIAKADGSNQVRLTYSKYQNDFDISWLPGNSGLSLYLFQNEMAYQIDRSTPCVLNYLLSLSSHESSIV